MSQNDRHQTTPKCSPRNARKRQAKLQPKKSHLLRARSISSHSNSSTTKSSRAGLMKLAVRLKRERNAEEWNRCRSQAKTAVQISRGDLMKLAVRLKRERNAEEWNSCRTQAATKGTLSSRQRAYMRKLGARRPCPPVYMQTSVPRRVSRLKVASKLGCKRPCPPIKE